MKRYGLIAIALVFVATLAAQPKKMEGKRDRRQEMISGSAMVVKNIDKGVIITVTSDDPELVKVIQNYWGRRAQNYGNSGMKRGFEGGKKKEKAPGIEKKVRH